MSKPHRTAGKPARRLRQLRILAASIFCQPVHLVGVIGHDFPKPAHLDMLAAQGITLDGVERSAGESFTWSGEYFDDMNTRTTHKVALNVLENWQPKLPETARQAATRSPCSRT
jgi:hypothetical protein